MNREKDCKAPLAYLQRGLSSLVLLTGLLMVSIPANAAIISAFFDGEGNDCAGFFNPPGTNGFDACQIFVANGADPILISPVIGKFDTVDGGAATFQGNGTDFPSIDGSEWTFDDPLSPDDGTGSWSYTPGAGDPGIRYWAAKAANAFNLFWQIDDGDLASCDTTGDVTAFTLNCLNLAQVVTSGDWDTGRNSLSHITFYDSDAPVECPPGSTDPDCGGGGQEIPEPGMLFLLAAGLFGLRFSRRNNAS